MLRKNVVKILTVGFVSYAAFVFTIMTFYPDKPEDMDWRDRETYNRVQITKLKIGATRDEVLALLGAPDITEARINEEKTFQLMFFRTQHVKADGLTTEDECTGLLFENDILIAWGDDVKSSFENS